MEQDLKKYQANYYDNSHLCGNCNGDGDGCRVCDCKGVTRWPLSPIFSKCVPPAIIQTYAYKYYKHYMKWIT